MKKGLIILIGVVLASVMYRWATSYHMKQKATSVTELLNDSSINLFYGWNYFLRGSDVWTKKEGGNDLYQCWYDINDSSQNIFIPRQYVKAFLKDFPITFSTNSPSLKLKYNNNTKTLYQDSADKKVLVRTISIESAFKKGNPFDTLQRLSKLKDKLGVFRVYHHEANGNFITFHLLSDQPFSSQFTLTYFPDNLYLNFNWKDPWEEVLKKGDMIAKNWYFLKDDKPS